MPNWSNLDELGSPHERAAARTRAPYEGIPQRDFPILDAIANKSSILGPLGEALGPGVPEYGDTQGMIERAVPLAMLGTGGGMLRGRAPGPGTELGAGGGWIRKLLGGSGGRSPLIRNPEETAQGIVRVFKGDVDAAHAFISNRAAKMKGDNDYDAVLGALRAMQEGRGNVTPMPMPPGVRKRLEEIFGEPAPEPKPAPTPAATPPPAAAEKPPPKKRAPNVIDWNRAKAAGGRASDDLPNILAAPSGPPVSHIDKMRAIAEAGVVRPGPATQRRRSQAGLEPDPYAARNTSPTRLADDLEAIVTPEELARLIDLGKPRKK